MTPVDDLVKMRACRMPYLRTSGFCWPRLCGSGGPAHATDELAVALGFRDVDDLDAEAERLAAVLKSGGQLSPLDATRALAAAEVVFVSDVFGAGVDWETVTSGSDVDTL